VWETGELSGQKRGEQFSLGWEYKTVAAAAFKQLQQLIKAALWQLRD
jgi:hypothetical protein